ncbi:MAG: hypothetical protein EOP62_23650 [Sphingomonadales bacterium]|nr:MAG: hypothetical protein EOP62_23650 [Sphingomonadales bacterium]
MRRQRRGSLIRLAALGVLALTGACAHNDVLVFGTSTTIGLNVQTASTNGSAPSIVLGYERQEAVWMPLLANGRDSPPICAADAQGRCLTGSIPASQLMYRSETERNGRINRDTYSVFASLGAHFNGRASTDQEVGAGGGLAQFFATGNAAVNISQNEALVTALKVESAEGAAAQARAVGAAAMTPIQQALVTTIETNHNAHIAKVLACAATPAVSWTALVNATANFSGNRSLLNGADANGEITAAQISSRLDDDLDAAREIAAQAEKLCPPTS